MKNGNVMSCYLEEKRLDLARYDSLLYQPLNDEMKELGSYHKVDVEVEWMHFVENRL